MLKGVGNLALLPVSPWHFSIKPRTLYQKPPETQAWGILTCKCLQRESVVEVSYHLGFSYLHLSEACATRVINAWGCFYLFVAITPFLGSPSPGLPLSCCRGFPHPTFPWTNTQFFHWGHSEPGIIFSQLGEPTMGWGMWHDREENSLGTDGLLFLLILLMSPHLRLHPNNLYCWPLLCYFSLPSFCSWVLSGPCFHSTCFFRSSMLLPLRSLTCCRSPQDRLDSLPPTPMCS